MTRREKTLGAVAGSVFLALLGYVVVTRTVIAPARKLDADFRNQWNKLQDIRKQMNRRDKTYIPKLRRYAARTFGTDELKAGDHIRTHLMKLIARSGVTMESLQAVTGDRAKGYREIGRAVQVRGTLEQVINLLYLLDAQPTLHRIKNVTIRPVRNSDQVELSFRYTSLLVELPPGVEVAGTDPNVADRYGNLDSDDRQAYRLIGRRDLFLPYVQRPQRPAVAQNPQPQPAPAPSPPADPPPPADPLSHLKVVGLTDWAGRPEVVVADQRTREVRRYAPGDALANGTVAMVDYRTLPHPHRPKELSPSRVVLQYGRDYWAVELGEPLSAKRRLPDHQLPQTLHPSRPQAEPSTPADEAEPSGAS